MFRFQRSLLKIVILTMLVTCLLLPVNLTGSQYTNKPENRLARTTINNRKPDDGLLFLHTVLAFLLFPVAVYVMRHYSEDLDFLDAPVEVTHTLQVEEIPQQMCKEENVKRHFLEAYPM